MNIYTKALIVDDSRLAREGLSSLLKAAGLTVKMANDATVALTKLRDDPVDVIFMDSRMPDCDSYQVVRSLTRNPVTAKIPVVICATKDTPEEREKAVQSGARGFLVKPLTARMVEKTLKFLQTESTNKVVEEPADATMPDWSSMPILNLSSTPNSLPTEDFEEFEDDAIPLLVETVESTSPISIPIVNAPPPVSAPKAVVSESSLATILEAAKQKGLQAGKKAGQEAGQVAGREAGIAAGQAAGLEAGLEAGQEAGYKAGQKAGHQAGELSGQQAGHQAGQQAGQRAGYQAGQQVGQQVAEKTARETIDKLLDDEFGRWKANSKQEVYEQVHNKSLPLVRKLSVDIAEKIALEVAERVAEKVAATVAQERAETVSRTEALKTAQVTAKSVATETAQATSLEATTLFEVQLKRKMIRYTFLIGLFSATVAMAVTTILHKYPLF